MIPIPTHINVASVNDNECANITQWKKNLDDYDQYLILKQKVQKCYEILDQQRHMLRGYNALAEGHETLRKSYESILLENKMWKADLERERWVHARELKTRKERALNQDTCVQQACHERKTTISQGGDIISLVQKLSAFNNRHKKIRC